MHQLMLMYNHVCLEWIVSVPQMIALFGLEVDEDGISDFQINHALDQ